MLKHRLSSGHWAALPHIPHPPPPSNLLIWKSGDKHVNIWCDTWPITHRHLNWNCNWTGIKGNKNIHNADKSPIYLQATQTTTWSRPSSQKWAVATMMVKSQIHVYHFVLRSSSLSASLKYNVPKNLKLRESLPVAEEYWLSRPLRVSLHSKPDGSSHGVAGAGLVAPRALFENTQTHG